MKVKTLQIENFRSIANSGVLKLGNVTLLVGKNNTGKSSIIRALHGMQTSGGLSVSDVRVDAQRLSIVLELADINLNHWVQNGQPHSDGTLTMFLGSNDGRLAASMQLANGLALNLGHIQSIEPDNFIYPYLSARKVTAFEEAIDQSRSLDVRVNLSNLTAKVDRLNDPNNPAYQQFTELVREIINIRLSAVASGNGKAVAMWIDSTRSIRLDRMGDGVAQMLGLIVQLCTASDRLFLIEELENDIHPEGLKALLRLIEEKSATNQFVISTHNNIVLRYLGALTESIIYEVTSEYEHEGSVTLPRTTINLVGNDVQSRTRLLTSLGYELSDFDLFDGWLILEESSAERIIREYLIPWFAPALSRVRTVAAQGTSDLERSFEALNKLVLFTHLQNRYLGRVWVRADNETSGLKAIAKLKDRYRNWPESSFKVFDEPDFELYYPPAFQQRAQQVLSLQGQAKRDGKLGLLNEVIDWIQMDPEIARDAFRESAATVINELRSLEQILQEPSVTSEEPPTR